LKQFKLPTEELSSFVLIDHDKVYTRSTGALHVAKKLSGAWPLLYTLIIVPAFIRNAVYDFIGTNRYKWFGKQDCCWLPSPAFKNKFL
jgi:predicted DCC family thiol-disulfide oxidoreductase YuxK